MVTCTVLFKGKDALDQMRLILEARGCPPEDVLRAITFDGIKHFLAPYFDRTAIPFASVLLASSQDITDFLDLALQYCKSSQGTLLQINS